MATYIGTELRSSRSASLFKAGDSAPPPDLAPVTTAVSNVQKLTTLTGLALDEAIRQYDPTWNGAGVTDEQRRQRAVTEQNSAIEQIAARAALIAAGAFTISQCEGNDDEGQYAVQTGMIWSPKLSEIAQAIYDPRQTVKTESATSPLEDQLDALTAENPDWMAYTQGARVYTDERGERVVLGFGVASSSSVGAADVAQARLRAMAAIQRFVGEKIEASGEDKDQFASRTLASGQNQVFDSSAFNQRVDARARDLRLTGAYEIRTWRGKHPWGQTPMQVVAMAWSPTSAATAGSLEGELAKSAQSAIRKGGIGETGPAPAASGVGASPSAAPVRSGASGSVSGF